MKSAIAAAALMVALVAGSAWAADPAPVPFDPSVSPVLKAAGDVAISPAGRAARDETIVSLPVRHGLTGVLKTEIVARGLVGKSVYPAGSSVFGIPMGFAKGPEIVWCLPRPERFTMCFPPRYEGYAESSGGGYFPTSLKVEHTAFSADKPIVERGPRADLPLMTLVVAFREWDKGDADVRVWVRYDEGEVLIGDHSLVRESDGTALLAFGGGLYRLSQEGKDRRAARIEVVRPAR